MRQMMQGCILWSGGKDSVLALHRARKNGIDIKYAITFYYRDMLFPPTAETIIAQAEALNLIPIIVETDLVTAGSVLRKVFSDRGIKPDCLIFGEGQIAADIRWFNSFCKSLGVEPVLPNFKISLKDSMNYLFDNGFKFIITRHSLRYTDGDLNFKAIEYNSTLFNHVLKTHASLAAGPFGPASNCQTFVYDGPDFKYPVDVFVENCRGGRVRLLSESEHSAVPQRIVPSSANLNQVYNEDTHSGQYF